LIATVILIGAVMALAVIIWLLLRGIVTGNTEKVDCSVQEQISVDMSAVCVLSTNGFSVQVKNQGHQRLDGLIVVAYYEDGATGLPPSIFRCDPGEDCTLEYHNPKPGVIKKLDVIPGVVKQAGKKNKLVACIDKLQQVTC